MAKTCQVDGVVYVAFAGKCDECAGHKDHLCEQLDTCDGAARPWKICPTRNVDTVDSLRAERDQLREINGELLGALEPFANYACDLENGETCECHNCRARTASAKARA